MVQIKEEIERDGGKGGLKKWTYLIGPYQERDRERGREGSLKKWTSLIGPYQERDKKMDERGVEEMD